MLNYGKPIGNTMADIKHSNDFLTNLDQKAGNLSAVNTTLSPDEIRDQAVDWSLRLQAEDCSEHERDAFERWLKQHPLHQELYDEVEQTNQWLAAFKTKPLPARQEALRYRSKPANRVKRIAAAAGVLLLVGTALIALKWATPISYRVATGQQRTVDLADGSRLELNTNSLAKVRINPWQRQVELVQGEAYFNVAHDSSRPFEVKVGTGVVRDLGTAFEIYKTDERVLVAVEEGRVEVTTHETRQLTAGQQTAYAANGDFINLDLAPIDHLTAWRRGQIVFHNQRLDSVLAEIARYHNLDIRLADSKLAALRVSGAFPVNGLDKLLNTIARVLHLNLEKQGDSVLFTEETKKS